MVVDAQVSESPARGWLKPQAADLWRFPALALVTTSILAVAMKPILDGEVSSGLIIVLGLAVIGARSGLVPALISAVIASAIFNFFITAPVLTFRILHGRDLAPPAIFTACAILFALLPGRLKDQTFQLSKSNLQLEDLLAVSRRLQVATSEQEIFEILNATVARKHRAELALFRYERNAPVPVGESKRDIKWTEMAALTLSSDAEIFRHEGLTGYLLPGSKGVTGALISSETASTSVDRSFMLALAQVIGLALERARFAWRVAEADANARTDELKSALLSSVSHDLRTPLTSITASASSLIEFGGRFDEQTSRKLLQGIVDECDRLNRFTANLLELTRLQAEASSLSGQVLSVNDVLRSVVQRMQLQTAHHEIQVRSVQQEILVEADTALFELALTNILQNALHYSEPGSTVLIQSHCHGAGCSLTITDEGCGIPESEQSKVFERFYRIKRNQVLPQGSGLGLAIAKGFVEAFNGSIEIRSPIKDGRGTAVIIRLPIINEASA